MYRSVTDEQHNTNTRKPDRYQRKFITCLLNVPSQKREAPADGRIIEKNSLEISSSFLIRRFFLSSSVTVIKTDLDFFKYPSSGKMKKTKLLTCTLLAAMLLLPLWASPASASTSQTFTLSSSANQLTYVMHAGTVFNGTVATTGMVRVWVNAPNGGEVANLGIIDETTALNFVAPQNGTYAVNFENDLPSSVQVTFSYVSNPAIIDNSSPAISMNYMIVTVVIAVVGAALIILLLRRQQKTKASTAKNKAASNSSAKPTP